MLGAVLDVFRLRQYFDVITRIRELVEGVREDAGFLNDTRKGLLPLPFDRAPSPPQRPFAPLRSFDAGDLPSQRVALVATGGSGALASVVGVARALEEAHVRPAVISLCSGSAIFGFPLAAGLSAEEVAEFTLELEPRDYLDLDWPLVARLLPTAGRGFAGILKGDALEHTYRRLLGDLTLGQLAVPAYAPIWNVEHNRLEYLGPETYPDLPVARAVRMAVALPLFYEPAELDGGFWCDGGIVDIFPVHPVLDLEERSDLAVAVNGFYPHDFEGEDVTGWYEQSWSILYAASQVRTCQQVQLARENLARLRDTMPVVMLDPVPYEKVRGAGFYRQFLSTRDWPAFMQAGRRHARRALGRRRRAAA